MADDTKIKNAMAESLAEPVGAETVLSEDRQAKILATRESESLPR